MIDLERFGNAKVLYLTTVGRISGLPRTIEIWFVIHDGNLYVLAEHGHQANWVKNIRANPDVHIRIDDQELDAQGRVLDPLLDQDLWPVIQNLARQKFDWGDGWPVQLTPYSPHSPM